MAQDKAGRKRETQKESTEQQPVGKNWLLAIAIDNYAHKPLNNCVRDVSAFIEVVSQRYSFESDHIIPLFDEEATADGIYDAFENLLDKVEPNDNLIVYYSGHGDYHGRLKEGYWIPFDADTRSRQIPNDTLKRYLREIQTRHTLIICDSCFSGTFAIKGKAEDYSSEALTQRYQDSSRWVITSGSKHEVLDGVQGGHSPFAEALLAKMRSHEGDLSARNLGDYVISELAAKKIYQKPLSEVFDKEYHQGGLFVFWQQQNATQAWASAEATDTAAAYYAFWQQHPDSPQAEEALWRYVSKVQKLEAYNLYRNKYPQGKYILDAIEKLDDVYFAEAKTLNDYKLYLKVFGDEGNHAREAHQRIDEFLVPIILRNPSKDTTISQEPRIETPRLSFEPEMVFVEGGTFKMGSNDYDSEKPIHDVTLSDFYIGKYPVTQAQWHAVMGENPSHFKGCDDCPVENVSWDDVQEFIKKLNDRTGKNYRLPTEAEWEYAARGGNKSKGYKYAGSDNLDEVGWYNGNAGSKTHPVGQKKPNELGIYDMSGNVWEWCADWYGAYPSEPQTNPTGPAKGTDRVVRGGSWVDFDNFCRVSYRFRYNFDFRNLNIGFRLAGY